MTMAAKPNFRFKQFSIWHDKCAMKVSTDGILLGAWAHITNDTKHVLDIGTGTGLLSLMVAQRLHNLADKKESSVLSIEPIQIDAIEINADAAAQAQFNFSKSPWASSFRVFNTDVLDWSHESDQNRDAVEQNYDLIICNPPYFSDSLIGDDVARNTARHNSGLPFSDLLVIAKQKLSPTGRFDLILPTTEAAVFLNLAEQAGFYKRALTYSKPTNKIKANRVLISLTLSYPTIKNTVNNGISKSNSSDKEALTNDVSEIITRDETGEYHPSFVSLCQAFYLKMPD
ncbi:methyltransferase [Psychrosphaera aestuarii]